MAKSSLTLKGYDKKHILLILCALGMIAVSVYLTEHFFEAHFPSGLAQTQSFCNVSGFWNCDTATYSSMSNIAYVPISFFGMLVGLFFLWGSIFPSQKLEKTNRVIAIANGLGCLALLIYSVLSLGAICPVCSVYYILSWVSLFLYLRYGMSSWTLDLRVLAMMAVPAIIGSLGFHFYYANQLQQSESLIEPMYDQFKKMKVFGEPKVESPYKLHMATKNFEQAPLRVSVFSDFQCPFCKRLAEQFKTVEKTFKNQLNVQYYFYPLDKTCNKGLKKQIHPHACQAAIVAACADKKFIEVHDAIFENQANINSAFLSKLAAGYTLTDCIESQRGKDLVAQSLEQGQALKIKGTPTVIVNGRKISAGLPVNQWIALFKGILRHQNH